jgi:p-hydroxybenzoate 3-monooxygenase
MAAPGARERTEVGIIGAGPAGLLLSHLLAQAGISSVVLERSTRHHIEERLRAGVVEHGIANLLDAVGVGERMRREGLVHRGIELRFSRRGHHVDFEALTGKTITVYGQQELVKDLIARRLADGGTLLFEAEAHEIAGIGSHQPTITYTHEGRDKTLSCSIVAGCDGFHGVSRAALPPGSYRAYETVHPFAWLGILAAVPPSTDELIYANHENGFALFSMRSPELSRCYLQVAPNEVLDEWPDERIWAELRTRFATDDGFSIADGPILERSVTAMRSFVCDPMDFGALVLAGDAAHIVPPTGAKGMNLALADVKDLAAALVARLRERDDAPLKAYSPRAVARAWQAQEFSTFMTTLLHPRAGDDFANRLQISRLEQIATSAAAARHLAERYVDLATTAGVAPEHAP